MVNPQKSVSLSDTLFPVTEVPAYWELSKKNKGNGTSVREMKTGHKFIIREDTNEVLSCMTDEYKLVTNETVMKEIEPVLKGSKAVFKEANLFGDGARTQWTWYFPHISVDVAKDDTLHPEINVRNSYDGTLELSFTAGAYRVICANGLIIGTIIDMKKNRHSIYNTNLYKIGDMINDTINKCNDVFVDDFQSLIETGLQKKHIARVVKELPQQAIDPFISYLGRNDMKNYWDLLNAFTWVTSHALNRRHESTHKLENKVYPLIRKMAKA